METATIALAAPRPRNGLGIAGCLLAFFGLFVPTGIVAVLGLMVSLVALGRAPRGAAAAGVVFGLIGTIVWGAIMIAALLAGAAFAVVAGIAAGAAFVFLQPEVVELTSDMVRVAVAVRSFEAEHGELPDSLEGLGVSLAQGTDPWGQPYAFGPADNEWGFELVSRGPDQEAGTEDDVSLATLDRAWDEAFDHFDDDLETLVEQLEDLDRHEHWDIDRHYRRPGHSI